MIVDLPLELVDDPSVGRMFAWAYSRAVRQSSPRSYREDLAEQLLRFCLQVDPIAVAAARWLTDKQVAEAAFLERKYILGGGIPDVVLRTEGTLYLWELKIDSSLTPAQRSSQYWQGRKNFIVVTTKNMEATQRELAVAVKNDSENGQPWHRVPEVVTWAYLANVLVQNLPSPLVSDTEIQLLRAVAGYAENASSPIAPLAGAMPMLNTLFDRATLMKESAESLLQALDQNTQAWKLYSGSAFERHGREWHLSFDPAVGADGSPFWFWYAPGKTWLRQPVLASQSAASQDGPGESVKIDAYSLERALEKWRDVSSLIGRVRYISSEQNNQVLLAARLLACDRCYKGHPARQDISQTPCCIWRGIEGLHLSGDAWTDVRSVSDGLRNIATVAIQVPGTEADLDGMDLNSSDLAFWFDAFSALAETLGNTTSLALWEPIEPMERKVEYERSANVIQAVQTEFLKRWGAAPTLDQHVGFLEESGPDASIRLAAKATCGGGPIWLVIKPATIYICCWNPDNQDDGGLGTWRKRTVWDAAVNVSVTSVLRKIATESWACHR